MSSRIISLTLALALLVPSVHARVGTGTVPQSQDDHSLLRRRLDGAELPLADKSIVNGANIDVVQLPKWNDVETPFMSMASPSDTSSKDKDEN
eukprot:scaffold12431_cov137-Skeletonema_dohrnii-CCMP3373.AAC.1